MTGSIMRANNTKCAEGALAAVAASQAVERMTRYRRAHEKALNTALTRLEEAKAREIQQLGRKRFSTDKQFGTDESCREYLRAWREENGCACTKCGSGDGAFLSGRDRWQCRSCRAQVSLRAGTVMDGSKLPLRTWFAAIEAMLQDPKTSTRELSELTGVHRRATVRKMAGRIRVAIRSPAATHKLAGLNQVFRARFRPAAVGVRNSEFLQNERVPRCIENQSKQQTQVASEETVTRTRPAL
jgi:transposase-like protein